MTDHGSLPPAPLNDEQMIADRTLTGGYNCAKCGAWVMEAQTHACYVARVPLVQSPVLTREDVNTIIRLLKEIEYNTRTRR